MNEDRSIANTNCDMTSKEVTGEIKTTVNALPVTITLEKR